ncbi:MAG: acetate/propionate family kinase [Rhodospirillaceae bacterium]|nr:acetate/propionate family kinase [Rhodospirillaceae bacterium]
MTARLLILNAGSSSVKFAVYEIAVREPIALLRGQIAGIGRDAMFTFTPIGAALSQPTAPNLASVRDHQGAIAALLDWLAATKLDEGIVGIGHRVVHGGGAFAAPALLDAATIERLTAFAPLAPHHQPHNLAAIRALAAQRPDLKQVACFDTAFHATQPALATRLGLPREYEAQGLRRYGFHGLSYDYVTGRLRAEGKLPARLMVAHLGNGCSMCAIRDGKSIATTMGFSTLDGLAMATRSGSIDPGALIHLMRSGMDAAAIEDLLYNRSGLLGTSGISADMKTLLSSDEPAAKEAVDFFCYRIVRETGSLAAALGGIDALAFTGGIGENAAAVRAAVARDLEWLGLAIDPAANQLNAPDISAAEARVKCYVVPTDEEQVIARHTANLLLASGD